MLDIERREHIDPSSDDLLDIEIALGVSATWRVGMSELFNKHKLRAAFQDRIQIHLGQEMALVLDLPPRDDLEAFEKRFGLPPAMRFDNADNNVDTFAPPGLSRPQHLIGLADPRRGAEKNLQPPAAFLFRRGQQRFW